MANFKPVATVATQRDTTAKANRKPADTITDEDLAIKMPLTDEENEKILSERVKELPKEKKEEPKEEKKEAREVKHQATSVKEEKKEEPKEEAKEEPKISTPEKEEVKKVTPKKEESKKEVKEEPKAEVKEEVKEEPKAEVKEEVKEEPKEKRPMTPEEKKAMLLENLRKGREKAQAQRQKESERQMATASDGTKRPVVKPKKAVDMSKMMTMTKKPVAPSSTPGKTCYHVSKRGETKEDRVWKVFIQESSKVIKLFDTQAEALDYAKQLAKNKADGSYVILHGLDGKIRKF